MKISIFADCNNKEEFITNYLNNEIQIVDNNPDIVISLGGDGTLLEAIHHYGLKPKYLPINWGSLGFLTSFEKEEFDISKLDFNKICEYDVLVAIINNKDYFFVNECQIDSTHTTNKYQVTLDNEALDYQASGIEIVAPLGTTGCSRANGGAIIAPHKHLFSINPIMPVNNSVYKTLDNPIICDINDNVNITCNKENNIVIDGSLINTLDNLSIKLKYSEDKLKLINPKIDKYYHRIKEKILN